MNKHLLGVIDATTHREELRELTGHRTVAAIPFGGRYRLIDFVLSNMVNSGVQSVAIFPKYQYRSLMDHLGSGRNWDLNRKRDGLFFFPATFAADCPSSEVGVLEQFANNIDFFKRSSQEYTVITKDHTVFNMDFNPLLEWHIDRGCDITEVKKNGESLGIYLLKTSLLLEIIELSKERGYRSMRDVINNFDTPYTVCQYHYEDYAVAVNSIDHYYTASMDLLKPEIWNKLFLKDRPILTKVKDEPPTRYSKNAIVQNSMIANGTDIRGTVINSIIARGVKIDKDTVVKNSIVMQKSQVGANSHLEYVIMDKDVKIMPGTALQGHETRPHILKKGTVQGVGMRS